MKKYRLLGQHFLTSEAPVKTMIKAAGKELMVEIVLEAGPGRGVLTHSLAEVFPLVVAIEKDKQLAEELKVNLESKKIINCEVVAGDVLKTDLARIIGKKSFAVIANIPYYLTSRLIRVFLEAKRQPSYMILMVQKEVAERVIAKPPQMSLLALSVQAYGMPEIIASVSKKEFWPQPKVDSAIIKISAISKRFFAKHGVSEKDFFSLLRAGFSQKRKYLSNALERYFVSKKNAEEKIKKAGLSATARAQELSLENWVSLLL